MRVCPEKRVIGAERQWGEAHGTKTAISGGSSSKGSHRGNYNNLYRIHRNMPCLKRATTVTLTARTFRLLI